MELIMKIKIIGFTPKGGVLSVKIMNYLTMQGHQCTSYVKGSFTSPMGAIPLETSLSQWTQKAFYKEDGLIFIGATGIAVRAIAPYIRKKTEDPAVLVVDQHGDYVISLLSGHIGGGNKLAVEVGKAIDGVPIITTATDLEDKFAVDQWAKENNLWISDMKIAKKVSATLIQDKEICFDSDFPVEGKMPEGLTMKEKAESNKDGLKIAITVKNQNPDTLCLVPKILTLGIGCRKDIPKEKIANLVDEILSKENLKKEAIGRVATIDLKADERGLLQFAHENHWPLEIYSSTELEQVEGDFTKSEFVKSITGVDNVCERSALISKKESKVIVKKQAKDGVTLAIAIEKYIVTF